MQALKKVLAFSLGRYRDMDLLGQHSSGLNSAFSPMLVSGAKTTQTSVFSAGLKVAVVNVLYSEPFTLQPLLSAEGD